MNNLQRHFFQAAEGMHSRHEHAKDATDRAHRRRRADPHHRVLRFAAGFISRHGALGIACAAFCVASRGATADAAPWTALTNAPPAFLDTCLLLTTGDVMCHHYNSNVWHRLSPDAFGSYRDGAWDRVAIPPMPPGNDANSGCTNCTYAPLYYASAVLPDGRAIVVGGEYLSGVAKWTNIGFIYDPVSNSWSSQLQLPFAGGTVGDSAGVVTQSGTYLLAPALTNNIGSLNPATGAFTALNPTGKKSFTNDEENWSLLYDGTILTVDSDIPSSFERYNPTTNTWGNSGATPVNLADVGAGTGGSTEVGPCASRPDNKLFCFSGNPLGQNALYDPSTNGWSHVAAMDFPVGPSGGHFAMADGASAALPNGNILAMASPTTTTTTFSTPSHFYELNLSTNALSAVADSPNAASFKSYNGRMLVLPTGEVLLTAYNQGSTQDVMVYSNGGTPLNAWRPAITSVPTTLLPGSVASISGTLFNGFSEGASYGDDAQSATNYPLVRITNTTTGHVFYARTFNHSRMGIEPVGSATVVSTSFQVPPLLDAGACAVEVIANGIGSPDSNVTATFSPTLAWFASTVRI
jgi:hypothetical protein